MAPILDNSEQLAMEVSFWENEIVLKCLVHLSNCKHKFAGRIHFTIATKITSMTSVFRFLKT